MKNNFFKAAAVQASPVFLDKKRTVEKACHLINEASKKGAKLVVFPESYIPCYPDWVWLIPSGKGSMHSELYSEFVENSVSIPDDSVSKLCRAAKKAKVNVVMGMSERNSESSNSSLYNTLLYIDSDGNILGKHRKLVPTGGERLVWAMGNGSTLEAYDTDTGKIGGLICWENYMLLARNAMYSYGTQVYVAPTWDKGESWLTALKHIANEGGLFVIGCCMVLRKKEIPDKYKFRDLYASEKDWISTGESVIVNPGGKIIAGPLSKEEGILIADIDLSDIRRSKWQLDTSGHYSRPDVFKFTVNKNPYPNIESSS